MYIFYYADRFLSIFSRIFSHFVFFTFSAQCVVNEDDFTGETSSKALTHFFPSFLISKILIIFTDTTVTSLHQCMSAWIIFDLTFGTTLHIDSISSHIILCVCCSFNPISRVVCFTIPQKTRIIFPFSF